MTENKERSFVLAACFAGGFATMFFFFLLGMSWLSLIGIPVGATVGWFACDPKDSWEKTVYAFSVVYPEIAEAISEIIELYSGIFRRPVLLIGTVFGLVGGGIVYHYLGSPEEFWAINILFLCMYMLIVPFVITFFYFGRLAPFFLAISYVCLFCFFGDPDHNLRIRDWIYRMVFLENEDGDDIDIFYWEPTKEQWIYMIGGSLLLPLLLPISLVVGVAKILIHLLSGTPRFLRALVIATCTEARTICLVFAPLGAMITMSVLYAIYGQAVLEHSRLMILGWCSLGGTLSLGLGFAIHAYVLPVLKEVGESQEAVELS